MDNVSKVIFTCLAIGYTYLLYQNNELKEDIETLKGYAQLDTDKAWERMDIMAEDIANHEDNLKFLYDNWKEQEKYNEELKDVVNKNAFKLQTTESNQEVIIETVNNIENYLVENFSGKLR